MATMSLANRLVVLSGVAALGILPSKSAIIQFQVTDLADTVPGQDLWEYSYRVSDFSFAFGQGFTVFFDRALFDQIENPPRPVNAEWDVITVQDDPVLSSDGFYDAQALVNAPLLPVLPGSQPYVIYGQNFAPLVSGLTTLGNGSTSSVPAITITMSAGKPLITVIGETGKAYTILRSTSLEPLWAQVHQEVAPPSGRIEFTDASAPSGQGFYRVAYPAP
jgi:hypothetical protein